MQGWRKRENPKLTSRTAAAILTYENQERSLRASFPRLDCSLPTKANRVQSPARSLKTFAGDNSAGLCCWFAGFLGDLPFPPILHSGAAPFSHNFTLIGSQELVVESRPNLLNQLLGGQRFPCLAIVQFQRSNRPYSEGESTARLQDAGQHSSVRFCRRGKGEEQDERKTCCRGFCAYMNTEAYCNILDNEMLPTLWRIYGKDPCYFQDDNARCHVSRATMQWYADNNVRRLDWPAQRPDINPIEHLWDELDRRVRARQARPKSIAQRVEWLQEEWLLIPFDVPQTLVDSMPDRVAPVIAARDLRWRLHAAFVFRAFPSRLRAKADSRGLSRSIGLRRAPHDTADAVSRVLLHPDTRSAWTSNDMSFRRPRGQAVKPRLQSTLDSSNLDGLDAVSGQSERRVRAPYIPRGIPGPFLHVTLFTKHTQRQQQRLAALDAGISWLARYRRPCPKHARPWSKSSIWPRLLQSPTCLTVPWSYLAQYSFGARRSCQYLSWMVLPPAPETNLHLFVVAAQQHVLLELWMLHPPDLMFNAGHINGEAEVDDQSGTNRQHYDPETCATLRKKLMSNHHYRNCLATHVTVF
ncbi:hypothetical protein PR048_027730 [Dryococelus australis]|uniref:Tc1-like transposase DDE domain-containing protein n=1 Tax=Dryococelus australis TaxID=614101 RepID=A0ABQ9GHC0_9NEOP|nr:hypothetical protein PR048_027730 [Dryococelus australis]